MVLKGKHVFSMIFFTFNAGGAPLLKNAFSKPGRAGPASLRQPTFPENYRNTQLSKKIRENMQLLRKIKENLKTQQKEREIAEDALLKLLEEACVKLSS